MVCIIYFVFIIRIYHDARSAEHQITPYLIVDEYIFLGDLSGFLQNHKFPYNTMFRNTAIWLFIIPEQSNISMIYRVRSLKLSHFFRDFLMAHSMEKSKCSVDKKIELLNKESSRLCLAILSPLDT